MITRRRTELVVVVVAVLVAATVAVALVVTHHRSSTRVSGTVRIPVAGGVRLVATVSSPQGVASPPLVVMPAAWNFPAADYRLLVRRLVSSGYAVVAYSQRGQGGSTGAVDFLGSATRADVSRVIDWALAHTGADPHRIGLWGTSYGGAASLLAAADDRRIRAVVATSAWTDLSATLAPNGTTAVQTISGLLTGEHLDTQLAGVRSMVAGNPQGVVARVRALSSSRSAMADVGRLNRNGTAVMLVNGFQDHVILPGQLVPFFDALTTPKRLEMQGGDHGAPGYDGVLGKPDPITNDGVAWLDRYVRGRTGSAATPPPVRLRDVTTGAWRDYRSWPAATSADVFDLATPGVAAIGRTPMTWTAGLTSGADSVATSGTGASYPPLTANLTALTTRTSVAWTGSAVSTPTRVTGTPAARMTIASSGTAATVFLYLYDVDPTGTGTLMSFAPYTASGLTAGHPRAVDVRLQPVAWTLGAGHRIALVIDTVDPRYFSAAAAGTTVSLGSSTTDPATVTIPLG